MLRNRKSAILAALGAPVALVVLGGLVALGIIPAAASSMSADGVTLTTPPVPGATSCASSGATSNDVFSVVGIKAGVQVTGVLGVYSSLPNGGGLTLTKEDAIPGTQPAISYPNPVTFTVVGTSQVSTYTAQLFYPPTSEWPVTDPAHASGTVHVRVSVDIYDPVAGQSYELGSGQEWDVTCPVIGSTGATPNVLAPTAAPTVAPTVAVPGVLTTATTSGTGAPTSTVASTPTSSVTTPTTPAATRVVY